MKFWVSNDGLVHILESLYASEYSNCGIQTAKRFADKVYPATPTDLPPTCLRCIGIHDRVESMRRKLETIPTDLRPRI